MDILIGTTNPSKINRFRQLLSSCDVRIRTPREIGIESDPEETGNTPQENAIIKATWYSRFFDTVICQDSGLYFDCLPLDDPRQPGLHIRTPDGRGRLDDEALLSYYTHLVHTLGGKVLAYYLDGVAVYHNGKVTSFMDTADAARHYAFYMVDRPSKRRNPGWPLASISLNRDTLTYFVDQGNSRYDQTEYRARLFDFLTNTLEINK